MKKTIYFLLLCVAGLLISCSEDDVRQEHEHEHSVETGLLQKKMISFDELKLKLSNKPIKSLTSGMINKGGDDYIQSIDSTNIMEISLDSVTTYTLKVNTLDDAHNYLSNLIIKEEGDSILEVIVHYQPTAEWINAFENNTLLDYEGEIAVVNTEGESLSNTEVSGKIECSFSIESYSTCTCEGHIEGVQYNPPCTCTTFENTYKLEINCGYTGGGGSGNGGGGSSGDGDQPGLPTIPMHGGSNGDGDGNYSTSAFENEIIASLTQEQIDWLNAHESILQQVTDYLEEYGQPQNGYYANGEAVQFVLDLVELLEEINYVTPSYNSSNYPGKNDGMPFNWWNNSSYLNSISFDPYDELKKLTPAEKLLVSIWPEQAYKIFKNKPIAESFTISKFGYNGRNDKSDAFRHSFFNAINTRDIYGGIILRAKDIVRLFGRAHESEVPNNLIKE